MGQGRYRMEAGWRTRGSCAHSVCCSPSGILAAHCPGQVREDVPPVPSAFTRVRGCVVPQRAEARRCSFMSHRFPQPSSLPSRLASCRLTPGVFCFCERLPFRLPTPCAPAAAVEPLMSALSLLLLLFASSLVDIHLFCALAGSALSLVMPPPVVPSGQGSPPTILDHSQDRSSRRSSSKKGQPTQRRGTLSSFGYTPHTVQRARPTPVQSVPSDKAAAVAARPAAGLFDYPLLLPT